MLQESFCPVETWFKSSVPGQRTWSKSVSDRNNGRSCQDLLTCQGRLQLSEGKKGPRKGSDCNTALVMVDRKKIIKPKNLIKKLGTKKKILFWQIPFLSNQKMSPHRKSKRSARFVNFNKVGNPEKWKIIIKCVCVHILCNDIHLL